MSTFRKRSKTVGSSPNRLKPVHAPKSRTPLTFRKFADFLLRRKTRRKAEQDPNSLVLEKQVWFHGKITAEYAERCMRREGDFLVREDPAKPGSCFLVVRCKNKTALHLPISKVKSSKGNRFKYMIEEGRESFDSISELINHHVHRRTPLTPKTGAIIVNVVSRDTTLLADEVFTPGASNEPFLRHKTDATAFATLRHTPLVARTRERKSSDPLHSTRGLVALNIDQGQVCSRESAAETQYPVTSPSNTERRPSDKNDSLHITVNPEDLYDKPENNSLVESLYDKPGGQHVAEDYYDKPEEHGVEEMYDKPENNSFLEELYDKPSNRPERVPSLRHSDPSAPSQRSRVQNRSSVPPIDSRTAGLQELGRRGEDNSQEKPVDRQRRSGGEMGSTAQDVDAVYSVPPLSETFDEYDMNAAEVSESVKGTENSDDTGEKAPETPPKDRNKIYLEVMRKLQSLLVEPFVRCDPLDLARHMTRIELEILWRQDLDREAWSLEDGSGGAEGLEMLTLPQGRSRRTRLIDRYTNVSQWVAALLVGAGDLGRRELVLAKLIELADVLSDKLGNLVSFMAIMDGLTLPQVSRLHHTWSCLHHQHSSTAILYHSTLLPLASLLQSGAPSPFPGVCLPYIVPLARFLEMSTEEVLDDWAREGVDLGLETMLAHLDSGRTLTQQLHVFRREAVSRLQGDAQYQVDPQFKCNFNVGNELGLAASPNELSGKVLTLLQWLSENAENIVSPTAIK